MEVAVFDTNNLPEGCILSIRAGNTRRQAPLPLSEPFRFPNLPFNARHFKVDVLHTRGSGRLDINAGGEEESYIVPVQLIDGSEAKVGLTVREQPSLCGKRAAELKQLDRSMRVDGTSPAVEPITPNGNVSPGDKASKVARDTREYARDHNLHNLVQEMLQYVLRERPEAPYAFMSSYLKRKAQERGEKPQAVEALLKSLGIGGLDDGSPEAWGSPKRNAGFEATKAAYTAPVPVESTVEAGDALDPERMRLEAEHISLRLERAELLRELAELEAGALAAR
jgi:hypothetical protein